MSDAEWSLSQALAVQTGDLIAFVGGGGKTSLMFALARGLPGNKIVTTTTRIFAAQMKLAQGVCHAADLSQLETHLDQFNQCLIVGEVSGDKALGVDPRLAAELLQRDDVDFVLIEADGSRMRPIKAPAAHEPVIPEATTLLVPVAGIDALDGTIEVMAHRPELVCRLLAGAGFELIGADQLSPGAMAALIAHELGGLKGAPPASRVVPVINKVETAVQLEAGRQVAQQLLNHPRIERVVLAALQSAQPVREVHRRVTGVVLAAGEARRMGRTKQLLPWGDTTVVGQTMRNLKASAVHDILVVTGSEAEAVGAEAVAEGVAQVHNPDYASGEMLSSLKTAVKQLPPSSEAVLVVLADQPMVEPETIDLLLQAFWRGKKGLIAPSFQGHRGNPVLIGRDYFSELLDLPDGAAPRALLSRHQEDIQLVQVGTDSVLRDLDSPQDYERWRP